MKKFYTLVVAALVAVSSVSAEGLKQLSWGNGKQVSKTPVETASKLNLPAATQSIKSVETKDLDVSDLSGNYTWSYVSQTQSNGGQTVSTSIKIEKTGNNIYTLSWNGLEFSATYSLLSKKFSIASNQYLGYNDANQIDVYFYNLDPSNAAPLSTPATATISGESLVFDSNVMLGIGNTSVGWFVLGKNNVFTLSTSVVWENPTMPKDGWVDCGTADFADPWQVAAYDGVDINEYAWTVGVEKNENIEGLYRMVNPYQNSPISGNNADPTGEGYIVFSVADPEFVLVYPLVYTGLMDEVGAFLNTNVEGYYMIGYENMTKELIISETGITPSTFDVEKGKVIFRNNYFGLISEPEELYSWKDNNNQTIKVDGWLQFNDWTGINGVGVDADENAPVEYYNLQGMRINNVDNNPGLYIRKQGNKATKVYVK